jgi:acyl-CoA synthetase (AMP-forming)/AMP-acid ligase II/aryl carrier-like protein
VILDHVPADRATIDGALLPPDIPSYVARLRWWADHDPHRAVAFYSRDGERDDVIRTMGEIDLRARAIAAVLADSGRTQGRALVVCPPGPHYHSALFGATYAGMTAVPFVLPRLDQSIDALRMAARVTEPSVLLSTAAAAETLRPRTVGVPELDTLRWVLVDQIEDDDASRWYGNEPAPDSPGYIILTSGSTSTPKGVVRSHRAMVAGIGVWPRQSPYQSEHGVSQSQPHTFSGLLHIHKLVHYGDPVTFVPIFDILERPVRWLRALSRTHAGWTPVNNLLLDVCVRNVSADERTGLDLSHVTGLRSSGEEIQSSALSRFLDVYGLYGLRRDAFSFTYASTEAAMVTMSPFGSEPVAAVFDRAALENGRVVRAAPGPRSRTIFSQSCPLSPQRVVIVDPETRARRADDELGEVWVAGPAVADGYWNDPEATAAAFGATLADSDEGPFLRTGDLGFLHDGELYITGRLKDIVIVRGRNLSPGDIEGFVRAGHPALTSHPGAAFGVLLEGGEELVVVQEVAPDQPLPAVARAARAAIAAEFAVQPHALVFIPPGTLPRTGSGKVQRGETRRRYERGNLEVLYTSTLADREPAIPYVSPRTAVERTLTATWEDVLSFTPIGVDDPFGSVGGDSLKAMQVLARLRAAGLTVTMAEMRTSGTISELARVVRGVTVGTAVSEISVDPVRLTPAQALKFARRGFEGVCNSILSNRYIARRSLDAGVLERALAVLVEHHEALRMTYAEGPEGVTQRPAPSTNTPILSVADLDVQPTAEEAVFQRLIHAAQARIDITRGPLLQVVLVRGGLHQRLILCIHHLATDAYAIDLLLRDLETAYTAINAGTAPSLPPTITSLRAYGDALDTYLASADFRQETDFIRALVNRRFGALPTDSNFLVRQCAPGPRSFPGRVTRRLAVELSRHMWSYDSPVHALDNARTRSLLRSCAITGTTPTDVLIYALLRVMHATTGDRDWLVDTMCHGRMPLTPEMDLSRTLGLFATFFPMGITINPGEPAADGIAAIQRQRQAPPNGGALIPLALMHMPHHEGSPFDHPRLSVNFQGAFDTAQHSELLSDAPYMPPHSGVLFPGNVRQLALFGRIADGHLRLQLRYHVSTFHPKTVRQLSEHLQTVVATLAEELG